MSCAWVSPALGYFFFPLGAGVQHSSCSVILNPRRVCCSDQTANKLKGVLFTHFSYREKTLFLSNVFFPSRRNSSYEWNSSAQVMRNWHSQSTKAVWWWEVLGVLNWKYCSVAMINADWVVYLLKTRFRQSGQPMWYPAVLVLLPTSVGWCRKRITTDANIWHWMKPFLFFS